MSESYELFDSAKHCDAALPINVVKDEFTFLGFVPLHVQKKNGKNVPVTVPRDYVNPRAMREIRFELGPQTSLIPDEFLRGEPFNPDWDQLLDPMDEIEIKGPEIVVVSDANALLKANSVTLESGETLPINLTAQNINDLNMNGATTLQVKSGERNISLFLAVRKPGVGNNTFQTWSLATSFFTNRVGNTEPDFDSTTGTHTPPSPNIFVGPLFNPDFYHDLLEALAPPKLDFVLCLPYSQKWKLMGYSRGELLNTISLAPEEETTIEIFTWDRLTQDREERIEREQEGLLEASFTNKDSTQTIKETTRQNSWNFNADLEVTIPIKAIPVKIGASGGTEASVTKINEETRERIAESVRKSSMKIKSSRQSKVSEKRETGREDRTIRKITNPNKSHTLNLDYFEILATHEVTTELDINEVRLCVLVPNLITDKIDRKLLLNYKGVIRNTLLSSVHDRGLDAANMLAAWEKLCIVKCKEPCPCDKPLPGDTQNSGQQGSSNQGAEDPLLEALLRKGKLLRNSLNVLVNADWDAYCDLPPIRTKKRKQEFLREKANYHLWLYWQIANDKNPRLDGSARTFLNNSTDLDTNPVPTQRKIELAGTIEEFVNNIDQSFLEGLVDIVRLPDRVLGTFVKMIIDSLNIFDHKAYCSIRLITKVGVDDANMPRAIQETRNALENYNNSKLSFPNSSQNSPQELNDEADRLFEESQPDYSDRDLAEALVSERALLAHIQNNESYYRQAIWKSFGAHDQFELLSNLGRLRDFVEPEVLGFVGNKVIMPYRTDNDTNLSNWLDTQKNNGFDKKIEKDKITLPTKGVILESRLGKCEALEDFLLQHRKFDLKRAEEEVNQAHQETHRRINRLAADPPILEPFDQSRESDAN